MILLFHLHYGVSVRHNVVDDDHGDCDGDEEGEERGHVVLVHPEEVSLVQDLHVHVLRMEEIELNMAVCCLGYQARAERRLFTN